MIKARDLRANIKEMGFERGVVHTLELALEEQNSMHAYLQEVANLVVRCVDGLERLNAVGDGMKREIDRIKRVHQQGEEFDSEPS